MRGAGKQLFKDFAIDWTSLLIVEFAKDITAQMRLIGKFTIRAKLIVFAIFYYAF